MTSCITPSNEQVREITRITGCGLGRARKAAFIYNAITELSHIEKTADSVHVSDMAQILRTLIEEAII